MPENFSDFFRMLTHASSSDEIDYLIHRILNKIRKRETYIRHPYEIDEIIHNLEIAIKQKTLRSKQVEIIIRELINSIDTLRDLSPSLQRQLEYNLHKVREKLISSEQEERKAKIRKKKEEQEKIIRSIGKIKLQEKDRILFFLGAGVSKPPPSNIPTINELLPELWKKSDRMETKPLKKLQLWCEENRIENIEEMLTAVTISNFIIKNSKVHGLLNSVLYPNWPEMKEISIRDIDTILLLENMLNTFFSLLVGTMVQAKPNDIHKVLAKYAKSDGNVDFLTTNYDACIDLALDELGVKYNYVLNGSESIDSNNLVKMHGSINWFYCDTCQNILLPPIKTIADSIEKGIPYAVLGMCKYCSAPARQFIIPPITYKFLTYPPIVQVWDRGRNILEYAKVFVIIGYSFSAADDYIAKMLVKAVGQDPKKNIIVVDIENKAIERCKSFIKSHVETFDEEKNFFPLQGDGVIIVPKIINSLNKTKKITKSTKKKAISIKAK
ncbi:MAG: SIR2 family NAD-dependent protein deacylase [Promethearchaeota archaeon]